MGGFGSGYWQRQRTHETVATLPELFASDFKEPSGGIIARPRDKSLRQAIRFRYLRSGRMIILFRSEHCEANSETIDPILKLDFTPCHFGGNRSWVLCPMPDCGRRVQSLFIKGDEIGCRQCHQLLYETQYGGVLEHKLTRIRAMHRQIFRGEDIYMAAHNLQSAFRSLIEDLEKIDRG